MTRDEKKSLILVIDDDVDTLEIIGTKLESSGFLVLMASDGEKGYRLAKEKKPDLIVLDLRMPGVDGTEVLSKVRCDPETEGIKILFWSSFNEYQKTKIDEDFAKGMGADGFVEKGINLSDLIGRIRLLLGR